MLHVIDLRRIIVQLAVATALLSVAVYYGVNALRDVDWEPFKILSIAPTIASCLVFVLFINAVWRRAWRLLRYFDKQTYPDLTGLWLGSIQPLPKEGEEAPASLAFSAAIRQTLISTQIDFHASEFHSITLAATPAVHQGQHFLYYVYRSEPHDPRRPPFTGTACLRIALDPVTGEVQFLRGQYHTVRGTIGTIQLTPTPSRAPGAPQSGAAGPPG